MNQPPVFHPDEIAEVTRMFLQSLTLICLRSMRRYSTMIPQHIFTRFAKFQPIICVNHVRTGFRLKKCLKTLFRYSAKCLFCMDQLVTIKWTNPARSPRTCDCYDDSPSSLRNLWSAVIKSPNFSARGTPLPVRLSQRAIVIWVLLHTSQFWSFGECVITLCFADYISSRG